jgi:HlyD family secretion protein
VPQVVQRPPLKGKWVILAGCAIVLSVLAFMLFQELPRIRKLAVKPRETANSAPRPAEVSLSGRIQSEHTTNVAARISGKIEAFHADIGQEVFEGQLIAQIRSQSLSVSQEEADAAVEQAQQRVNKLDSAIIAARLEASRARADASRANADFARTQRTYQRQKMLLTEGATPKVVAQKAEKEFLSAEQEWNNLDAVAKGVEERVESLKKEQESAKRVLAQMLDEQETVKAQLAAGEVHSPVNGVVIARRGEQGGDVDQSVKDLFQIAVDLTQLQFIADADPGELAGVHAGQPATIHVAELPGESLPGNVEKVEKDRVIIGFTSPNPVVKPGLTAQAAIQLK